MELIVFDLDGTLLDSKGEISTLTRRTLADLSRIGVAYTVATGRTLHASRQLLQDHSFGLPHVYKNGVMIWDPATEAVTHQSYLQPAEVRHVVDEITRAGLSAFVFALGARQRHLVFHSPAQTEIERGFVSQLREREGLYVGDIRSMPDDIEITNLSTLGAAEKVAHLRSMIDDEPNLVAYSGNAWDGDDWRWLDIQHAAASKGGAIDILREQLDIQRVVCFGDSDNDLSMFERADESYAPSNAEPYIQQAASAVIGRHDEDGIALFLRERFCLDG